MAKIKNSLLLLCVLQIFLIPQASANTENLIDAYFEKLEDIIRLEDYKSHKKALTKFYEDRVQKNFHRTVTLEYYFKSCLKSMEDEYSKESLEQNRDTFLKALFPAGVVMIYRAFDHEIISKQVNEDAKEISVEYSLDLGGDIVRSPGHQGLKVDYAPLVDLRKCHAVFSVHDNALIMQSEQCYIIVREGNLDSWQTKDFKKGGCDEVSKEAYPGALQDIEKAINENFTHLPPLCNTNQEEPCGDQEYPPPPQLNHHK